MNDIAIKTKDTITMVVTFLLLKKVIHLLLFMVQKMKYGLKIWIPISIIKLCRSYSQSWTTRIDLYKTQFNKSYKEKTFSFKIKALSIFCDLKIIKLSSDKK